MMYPAPHRSPALLYVFALTGLVVIAPGCSSTRPPQMSVRSGTLTQHSENGVVLTFELEADNPNPDPLPLEDLSYEVFLDGQSVFRGTRSAQATVRRFGRQRITLPAAIPRSADQPSMAGVRQYELRGRITYLKPGALAKTLFDIDVLRPSAGFVTTGSVDLSSVEPVKERPARPLPDSLPGVS